MSSSVATSAGSGQATTVTRPPGLSDGTDGVHRREAGQHALGVEVVQPLQRGRPSMAKYAGICR
jgi:hypothetical protein